MNRKFSGDTLLIATHNAGKLEEMRELLAPFGVSVVGAAEKNLPEPEETEDNFVALHIFHPILKTSVNTLAQITNPAFEGANCLRINSL